MRCVEKMRETQNETSQVSQVMGLFHTISLFQTDCDWGPKFRKPQIHHVAMLPGARCCPREVVAVLRCLVSFVPWHVVAVPLLCHAKDLKQLVVLEDRPL